MTDKRRQQLLTLFALFSILGLLFGSLSSLLTLLK